VQRETSQKNLLLSPKILSKIIVTLNVCIKDFETAGADSACKFF
jgi:hypothetical protein